MRPRFALSLGNFFVCVHHALMLYITTPFLATVMPENFIGLVLSLGALFSLCAFPFVPRLVRNLGARRLALWSIGLSACFVLSLALNLPPLAVVFAYALFFALTPINAYFLDLLLEAATKGAGETGRVRTLFITFGNLGYLSCALGIGLLLGSGDTYANIFYIAAVALIPFLLMLRFAHVPDGDPPRFAHILEVAHCLIKDRDYKAVGVAYLTLQFFFNLVPYFIPLYLHTVLGIPWSELGWIFAVIVIPFLLLEYPAGWLADKVLGDQELMAIGFLVMGAATAAIAFTTAATPILAIGAVLFVSRIGAALAEAMCETHFFRRVSERDANSVGVFRMMRPMGAVAAPLTASVFLSVSSFNIMFFVVGLGIIVFGVAGALSIKDVR
ncbi:MAG TPA: MFS transporter [Candidatus Paceibacterota bacterium]|nr:MFS transporter [Candidatus Paceibacterota bacterium]